MYSGGSGYYHGELHQDTDWTQGRVEPTNIYSVSQKNLKALELSDDFWVRLC